VLDDLLGDLAGVAAEAEDVELDGGVEAAGLGRGGARAGADHSWATPARGAAADVPLDFALAIGRGRLG
jgi:hypothetical protein